MNYPIWVQSDLQKITKNQAVSVSPPLASESSQFDVISRELINQRNVPIKYLLLNCIDPF